MGVGTHTKIISDFSVTSFKLELHFDESRSYVKIL